MKAIETRYAGCRFRSRLEARWAVFFDTLGIAWEYEPEGFELDDGQRYLPDFWLPHLRIWFEVKGSLSTHDAKWRKLHDELNLSWMLGEGWRDERLNGCASHAWGDFPVRTFQAGTFPLPAVKSIRGVGYMLGPGSPHAGWAWSECHCGEFDIAHAAWNVPLLCGHISEPWQVNSYRIMDGLTAARSARFEHGESG